RRRRSRDTCPWPLSPVDGVPPALDPRALARRTLDLRPDNHSRSAARPLYPIARTARAVRFDPPRPLRAVQEIPVPDYIPSPREWVRDQVELYERSGGTQGTTLRDTGLPVIIVTHVGNKTGAIRKTPLMQVKDGANYVLVGSVGGAPTNPVWVY